MKITNITSYLFITLLIAGCNTIGTKAPSFNDTPKPVVQNDKALIYVYRLRQGDGYRMGTIEVTVDNKNAFDLKDKSFTSFYLTPGEHTFNTDWYLWDKPLFEGGHFDSKTVPFKFDAGETYYIGYSIKSDNKPSNGIDEISIIGKAASKTHITSAGLFLDDKDTALNKLSVCGYFENDIK